MRQVFVDGLAGFHIEEFSEEVLATGGTIHGWSDYPGRWTAEGSIAMHAAADFSVYGNSCTLYGDVPDAFVKALEKYKVKKETAAGCD